MNASTNTDEVETTLSLHPEWNVPQEQEYVFRFLSNELEPLKPNQISLSGIDIDVEPANGSWLVKAFFRSSLDQQISVGSVELMLLDEEGKTLASDEFDLNELGDIPARSARPWVFVFTKDNIFAEQPPTENWKLAFNVQSMVPHKLEFEQAWEDGLTEEQKDGLAKVVEGLPKLKPREVNISGFQVKQQDDGGIAASVFIRNGHSKQINIEKLPLELIDATGDLSCKWFIRTCPTFRESKHIKTMDIHLSKRTDSKRRTRLISLDSSCTTTKRVTTKSRRLHSYVKTGFVSLSLQS